jgi:UDP-glucose 4-epimerase
MQKKIIITGGAGFIGSHLVDFFVKKNYNVVVIDDLSTGRKKNLFNSIQKIKFYKYDISKVGKWESLFRNAYAVYHLAAKADIVPSIIDPAKYHQTNIDGTFNVVNSCKKYYVKKIIYAASSSCYGLVKKIPTDEKSIVNLHYPYAFTKNLGEQIINHFSKLYKLSSISLRLFNVYGPRSRTTGAYGAVFGVFLAQKLNNKPLTIVGDGKQSRDFVHVLDVVNAFYKALFINKNFEIFNIGFGKSIKINVLADLIGGKKVFIPRRPGEPNKTLANIKKAKKQLKWKPKIDFYKGVRDLLKNLDDWKFAPVWTKSKIAKETQEWIKRIK